MKIVNFGGNVIFEPKNVYEPRSEEEVLKILNKHKDRHIRAMSSLHAWSNCAVSEDISVNLKHLNKVEISKDEDGTVWATVGGGCVLQDMLDAIGEKVGNNLAMPTLGGLKRQTIAGAISTATHGSGKSSLSHYMEELRVAAYGSSGKAKVYDWKEGKELRAARCAIGCMGVILSVKFRLIPQYWIEEKLDRYKKLEQVIAKREEYPLQQFILFPYLWEYFSFQRRIVNKRPNKKERLFATLMGFYDYLIIEIITHAILRCLIVLSRPEKGSSKIFPWFYRSIVSRFMSKISVINESEKGLTLHTLHHHMFRHLEMEIFLHSKDLAEATEMIRTITSVFAGTSDDIPKVVYLQLKKIHVYEELMRSRGSYTHHYPFFFRYVEPDDTLISMTSDTRPRYSISFFTYLRHEQNKYFYRFAEFSARVLVELYGARLHWGKYFPLNSKNIEHLYPSLSEFRQICGQVDPKGVFQNDYTKRVLGFKL